MGGINNIIIVQTVVFLQTILNDEEDHKNFYRHIAMYISHIYIYVRFVIKLHAFMYKHAYNTIL